MKKRVLLQMFLCFLIILPQKPLQNQMEVFLFRFRKIIEICWSLAVLDINIMLLKTPNPKIIYKSVYSWRITNWKNWLLIGLNFREKNFFEPFVTFSSEIPKMPNEPKY